MSCELVKNIALLMDRHATFFGLEDYLYNAKIYCIICLNFVKYSTFERNLCLTEYFTIDFCLQLHKF